MNFSPERTVTVSVFSICRSGFFRVILRRPQGTRWSTSGVSFPVLRPSIQTSDQGLEPMVTVQLAGPGRRADGVSVGWAVTGGVVGSMVGAVGRGGVGDGAGLGVVVTAGAGLGAVDGVVDPALPDGAVLAVAGGLAGGVLGGVGAGGVGAGVGSGALGAGRVMVETLPLDPTGSSVAGITRMRPGSW